MSERLQPLTEVVRNNLIGVVAATHFVLDYVDERHAQIVSHELTRMLEGRDKLLRG